MSEVRILNKFFVNGFYSIVNPLGEILENTKIHPHAVTIAGFLFSILSGFFFWIGMFVFGGVSLILSGVCDVLDGRIARKTSQMTKFGALFDSTIDRYSEIAAFIGIMAYYHSTLVSLTIVMAIAGSLLTSYVRARAEGLNIDCKIGLMQRPERITFISVGAIIGPLIDKLFQTHDLLMVIALVAIAILSNITVVQRVMYVRAKLNSE
jgi:CDP-diacylglycerol--glycerol-3-phosphate 3-phosphatidyltransferase